MKKSRKERKQGPGTAEKQIGSSRREFLGQVGALTAASVVASVPGATALGAPVDQLDSGGLTGVARAEKAYQTRVQAALFQKIAPKPDQRGNGDEDLYPNRIGSYSKGLPHNQLGEVEQTAYESFLQAVKSGNPDDFDRIIVGGSLQLKNPQAGIAYEMIGLDPMGIAQPPAPAFGSAEVAAEIAENYWMALARDVNFQDYETHPLINMAVQDLNGFTDFRGPKFNRATIRRVPTPQQLAEDGAQLEQAQAVDLPGLQAGLNYRTRAKAGFVTAGTLFRGLTPGDLTGPYISQFLWKDAPFGSQTISQRMRTVNPGTDYLTSYGDWLDAQNGRTKSAYVNDPTPRYIRNGRDLSEWVHIDVLYQAYFNAMLILLATNAPVDPNNPYNNRSRNQCGFGTFGPPHIAALLPSVATAALRTVWHQKWYVHRRLRPEVFAGRIHNHLSKAATYPIHPEILNSAALPEVNRRAGTWLLPMAFPEGSPAHPAYGAGHATVAGACVTILKAWFDESYVIPDPVVPTADGLALTPYRGSDSLTVGGELNKLASNVGIGRNIAGVHWRSDATESLKLGEAIAIAILQDYKGCYNERFEGFSLTKFDGTRIVIG
ncbi:MAG: vanadium-dependent haloperoxidase [Blastocatellia bacterium]|nr:vanadium-dependent haloperoxidase [Blastocatellia bacterium]